MADGDGGLLLAAAAGDLPELGGQVGVLGAARRPSRTRSASPAATGRPWRSGPRSACRPTRCCPGTCPAHDARWPAVGKRVMSAPISATMTSAARCPPPGSSQPVAGPRRKGPSPPRSASSRRAIAASRWSTWARCSRSMNGVVVPNRPGQRLRAARGSCSQPALASSASTSGSRSPAISASSIARPDTPSTSVATEASLMLASSSTFWTRCDSRACVLDQLLAVAGQVPQLADRRRRARSWAAAGRTRSSWAIHSASLTSVLRPGTFLMGGR